MKKQIIIVSMALLFGSSLYAQQNNKQEVMVNNTTQEQQLRIAQSYYEKINSGDFDNDQYYDLFTADVKLFYPKFGFAEGKAGIKQFGEQVRNLFKSLTFELDKFNFIVTDNTVVVEGVEKGEVYTGLAFPDNKVSYGKFCTVFEFEGNQIKRMYCYVDPDHAAEDERVVALLKKDRQNEEVIN